MEQRVLIVLLISASMTLGFVIPVVAEQQPPDQQQPPPGPPPNTCPICHENFSSFAEVMAHQYVAHFTVYTDEHPLSHVYCLICDAQFSTLSEAASHISTAHAENRSPLSETYCPFCGEQITNVTTENDQYAMYVHWTTVHDWWPTAWEPPENWWPGGMRPPSDWTPPSTWEVPENLLEDVVPPYMPENSWMRPENWTPREDWVPSERWEQSSDQPIPELMPENLGAIDIKNENYHWVPPENKSFWICRMDNATTDAPVGFYMPENSTPFTRLADNWTPAERTAENVAVGGVNMNVRENVSDVVITTLPLEQEDLPENVSPLEGNFCEFFQVGTNIPALVENAEIGVKVDQDWIVTNNLDNSSITLEHCVDGVWTDLPTEIKGEDENYLYCSAQVPSFSVFAVTGETMAAGTTTTTTTTTPTTTTTASPTTTTPPTEGATWAWIGVGIAIVIVIAVVVLLLKRGGK